MKKGGSGKGNAKEKGNADMRYDGPGALISPRNQPLTYLNKIHKSLDSENLKKFRSSCFGRFLDMSDMKFQGQLLFKLYESLTPESLKRRRMSFIFNEKEHELGPVEFYTITGLSFKGWESPPERSNFHDEVFGGKKKLFFQEVWEKFETTCKETGGTGELCLKLALLVILYGLLLIRHKHTKRIEVQFMHLLDDLTKFNSFPWGLIAYEFLVTVSHNIRVRIQQATAQGLQAAIDAHGFTFALQVFAYELNGKIGLYCANQRPDMVGRIPRMLRWTAIDVKIRYSLILGYFNSSNSEKSIVNTPAEKLELEYEGIGRDWKCDVDVDSVLQFVKVTEGKYERKRKFVDESRQEDDGRRRRRRISDNADEQIPKVLDTSKLPTASQMEQLLSTMKEVLETLKSLDQKMDQNGCSFCATKHTSTNNDEADLQHGTMGHGKGTTENVENLQRGREVDGKSSRNNDEIDRQEILREGDVKRGPNNEDIETVVEEFIKELSDDDDEEAGGPRSTAKDVKTPAFRVARTARTPITRSRGRKKASEPIAESGVGKKTPRGRRKPVPLVYGRNDVPFPLRLPEMEWVNKFEQWYETNRLDAKSPHLTRIPYVGRRHASWFQPIWYYKGWLLSDQIDCLVSMLISRSNMRPNEFVKNWTTIENLGWNAMISDIEHVVRAQFKPYVEGSWPRELCMPWSKAERVVSIGWINPDHWVCYEIKIEEQVVIVYDSLSESRNPARVIKAFKPALKNLAWMCRECNVWRYKEPKSKLKEEWDLVIFRDPPQQGNTSNCGVFALKFMECLITGHDVHLLHPDYMPDFRKAYCAQIYRAALEGDND